MFHVLVADRLLMFIWSVIDRLNFSLIYFHFIELVYERLPGYFRNSFLNYVLQGIPFFT